MIEELSETLNLVGVLGIKLFFTKNLKELLRDETGIGQLITVAHEPSGEADSVFVGGFQQSQLTTVGLTPLWVEEVVAGSIVGLERLLLTDRDVLLRVALVLSLLCEHRVVEGERTQSADVFARETTAVKGRNGTISLPQKFLTDSYSLYLLEGRTGTPQCTV